MMRCRLRTLALLVALSAPVLAVSIHAVKARGSGSEEICGAPILDPIPGEPVPFWDSLWRPVRSKVLIEEGPR
jgi:hypothetical protein